MSSIEDNRANKPTVPSIHGGGEPFFGFRGEDLMATAGALAKEASANPTLLLEEQAGLVRDVIRVLAGQSELRPAPKDKRFLRRHLAGKPVLPGVPGRLSRLDEVAERTHREV